jgi:hypothetical protein
MARGFTFRRGKGAYAVNYDLHKLAGMAAIPFLLMWAVTGAGFEFKQIGDAWYAVLPGDRPAEYKALESKPLEKRSVTMAQAERIARNIVPTGRLSSVLVLHGVARLATLAGSPRSHDLPVGVGYVIAGALVLPLAAGSLSGALLDGAATPTASGWDSAALALAAAATVVVALRIHATWP